MKNYLGYIKPRSLRELTSHLQNLISGRLWVKILIALLAGLLVGTLLGPDIGLITESKAQTIGNWLALPGNIFLRLIQMIVVPLVFSSIITGLAASESIEQLKSMGLKAVGFFIVTTTLAIVIGIVLTGLIQPGSLIDHTTLVKNTEIIRESPQVSEPLKTPEISQLPDVINSILPNNPLGSMVEKEMLQVVIFAVILGIALFSNGSCSV